MRFHTLDEARAVVDTVADWQDVFQSTLGKRMVYAADEYYLMAQRPFPDAERYDGFHMHEDGIGMARTFEAEFHGRADDGHRRPARVLRRSRRAAEPCGVHRPAARRVCPGSGRRRAATSRSCSGPVGRAPVGVLTGTLGAPVIAPLIESLGRDDVRVLPVDNEFFGGNTGVTGLMTGEDVTRVLAAEPDGHRYLLPDVCLSDDGRFLDGVDDRRTPATRSKWSQPTVPHSAPPWKERP